MKKTYRQVKYGTYAEGDTAVTLRSMSGDYGGGSEVLVVEPIVFRDDITIKVDGGGYCLYPRRERLQGSSMCELSECNGNT